MSTPPAIATVLSVGEAMLECIVHRPQLPEPNTTLVVDPNTAGLGGAAVNIAWYFARLGDPVRLVAPIGTNDSHLLSAVSTCGLVDTSRVLTIPGHSDLLVTAVSSDQHLSVYALAPLPAGVDDELLKRCEPARAIVLNGSRHRQLRRLHLALAKEPRGSFLVFNPSYAIYEYERRELHEILAGAHITVVNQQELKFIEEAAGTWLNSLGFSTGNRILVVTKGSEGAEVRHGGTRESLPSPISKQGVFFGAGDALTAAFVHDYLRSFNPSVALRYALAVAAAVVDSGEIRAQITESTIRRWL